MRVRRSGRRGSGVARSREVRGHEGELRMSRRRVRGRWTEFELRVERWEVKGRICGSVAISGGHMERRILCLQSQSPSDALNLPDAAQSPCRAKVQLLRRRDEPIHCRQHRRMHSRR